MTPVEWEAALKRIAPNGKPWIILGFADALPALCNRYDFSTVARQAHFIAQCAHESDGFGTTVEYADGSAYEGRKDLGNIHPGDGKKYKGRGLIQLTGRFNYEAAAKEFGLPFIQRPQMVAEFPEAANVAGWFWDSRDLNRHADRDDVEAVTRVINGGVNGLDSRTAYLATAKTALA